MKRWWIIVVMLGGLILAGQAQSQPPVLSISALPVLDPPPTILAYIDAVRLSVEAGATGNLQTETWSKLEPAPGELAIEDFTNGMAYWTNTYDVSLFLGIQVINTVVKEVPPDLQDTAWDAPEMIDRFKKLLDALAPHIDDHVRYLSIGNEVDAYLAQHPDEWATYQIFYEAALDYVHDTLPGVQVGVTTTFGGMRQYPAEVAALNARSDVFMLTYYPLNPDFTVASPDSPLDDFPEMLAFVGDMPLILQEVGYPSSEILNSSEAAQAEFVTHVFDAWNAAGDRIPWLNYFLLHDFSDELTDGFLVYYGLPNIENFYAYLRTLGLRNVDGTPKLAWQTFLDAAQIWKEAHS